ncbi:hypothetical protein SKAU_G00283880 [Synaphobranchus kaupii]|uniref:Uncharacterized protein n=1 Tax=Synaphobranchus kaupii TaxID=118154 RepID=A0A9Q1IM45_SYNKA|nr:hypothetical protein SKAU_G00283880 [Synaphobranchus kaupii]
MCSPTEARYPPGQMSSGAPVPTAVSPLLCLVLRLPSQLSDQVKAKPDSRSLLMVQAAQGSCYSQNNVTVETQHFPNPRPLPPPPRMHTLPDV